MSTKDDALIKEMLKAFRTISSEFGDEFVAMRVVSGVARKAILEEAAGDRADLIGALKKISRSRNRNLTAPNKLAAIYEIVDAALAAKEQPQ